MSEQSSSSKKHVYITAIPLSKSINIMNVIDFVKKAWNNVTSVTMKYLIM